MRRRTVAACCCLLACVSWLPLLLVEPPEQPSENSRVETVTPDVQDVLLVSHAPACEGGDTFFATKSTQTKLHLAQRRGWRLWVSGDEYEGMASAAALVPLSGGCVPSTLLHPRPL